MNTGISGAQDSGKWEKVKQARPRLLRMKVPGGWLVTVYEGVSYPVSYYPDPEHKWNPLIKT